MPLALGSCVTGDSGEVAGKLGPDGPKSALELFKKDGLALIVLSRT